MTITPLVVMHRGNMRILTAVTRREESVREYVDKKMQTHLRPFVLTGVVLVTINTLFPRGI